MDGIEIFLAVLGLVLGAVLAFCFGMLPPLAVASGPGGVLFWGIVVTAVIAIVTFFVGVMVTESRGAVWFMVAVFVIAAFAPTAYMMITGNETAAIARQMAPQVQEIGGRYFDEIDTDHDGTLTDGEQNAALDRLSFSNSDRTVLEYMKKHQSDVGHVIDSYSETSYVWISTGNGGGYMSPVTSTTYIYGISKADLATYTDRTTKKYEKW